ncbi:MAG: penicillin-binding transpeptidase domain-containing protein [Butyricicoccaceae bacterium]
MTQKKPTKSMKNRLTVLILLLVFVVFLIIAGRLVWLQVVRYDEFVERAADNQTADMIITPKRGTIYDRNRTELVSSATTQEVCVNPNQLAEVSKKDEDGNAKSDEQIAKEKAQKQAKAAQLLSEKLELDYETVLKKVQKNTKYARIARQVETTLANEILAEAEELGLKGFSTAEDSKRYYRYGSFASQLLGFTGSDGQGLSGVEYAYDDVLKGTAGRIVKAQNALGTDMPYDYEKYVPAEDGDSIVLTIDEGVQHYLEKHLENALEDTDAKNGVCGIVMNIKTGEVLGMATKPDFDLGDPYTIPAEAKTNLAELEGLTGEEYQQEYSNQLYSLWKNKTINYTYEPGSTFKVFTVSSALESGVVTDASTFSCGGVKIVDKWDIHCWKRAGHGSQTLAQTLQNSCNVAMMDISASLGTDLFEQFFQAFGLREKSGIDLPGEEVGVYFEGKMNEVDLATGSFGQNFTVTPLQELGMVAAVCNGGNLVTPYVVKEIVDSEGNIKKTTETNVRRQVVSAETSELMCQYLQWVVDKGTGQNAYVAGYRVGGKTATTEKLPKNSGNRIASFIGVAPMDDPTYAVIVLIDEPQTANRGGGALAAPVVGRIFTDILPYLGVEAVYSDEEQDRKEVSVPSLIGMTREEAEAKLEELDLGCRFKGDGDTVTDQLPVEGVSLQAGSSVVLYCDEKRSTEKVTVPNVKGLTPSAARDTLESYGLYMKQNGVASSRVTGATASINQSPNEGAAVAPGSVVTVEFSNTVTSEE